MKSGELVVVVDSVEQAIKFYTEKLAFDIAALKKSNGGPHSLSCVQLRKGKCIITFREPYIEELAEFSFIKRCVGRCVSFEVEIKNDLDKYFDRCKKKEVKIVAEPRDTNDGRRLFSIKDPFGVKLVFSQTIEEVVAPSTDAIPGIEITPAQLISYKQGDEVLLDKIIDRLKDLNILRRAAKKYAKNYLKSILKASELR